MDALVSKCANCGEPLREPRKLKKFCSYACRGQQRAIEAATDRTGLIRSKNPQQNKELRRVKMQSVGAVTFAKVNSCTYRVGTRNKRAAGWLMDVAWPGGSRQRWVARVGDRASEPLSLDAAKQAAISFLHERGKVQPRDFIAELNQIAANEVDRIEPMPTLAEVVAIERANFPPLTRVPQPEALQGDPLEYYEDGYPVLPDCLRRT